MDAGADGYMRGEGCIVHLLQAFQPDELVAAHLVDQAAVLYGTAVNQDGRSSSLTVRIPLYFAADQHQICMLRCVCTDHAGVLSHTGTIVCMWSYDSASSQSLHVT